MARFAKDCGKFLSVTGLLFAAALGYSSVERAKPDKFVKNELIVKLKPRVNIEAVTKLHESLGGRARSRFKLFSQFQVVTLPEGTELKRAIRAYAASPFIEYAERNLIYRASEDVPVEGDRPEGTDELFGKQWGLRNLGTEGGVESADIDALKAWQISKGAVTDGKPVVVAVIDTGVDYTHPDLAKAMWVNEGETAGDGVDNDGNGFIDDVHGYDFAGKDGDPMDDHSHGTHCAGVIAAQHDGQGIMGIAPEARIMGLKFLSAGGGGTLEDAMLATEYAILNGAHILSNSWGGDGYSKAMEDIIEKANAKGILYVAAAGNEHSNNDTQPTYPASYKNSNVISVAASDNADKRAYFTNWGKESVHLAAPGVGILSTILSGRHKAYSGTSMACPHVAGAAAVLKAKLGLAPAELKARLMATVEQSSALRDVVVSGGRLNLYNALEGITPPPAPPETGWTEVEHSLASPHPYPEMANLKWTIHHPGASEMRIHFEQVETEKMIDYVGIEDGSGRTVETLTGKQGSLWSRTIPGDTVTIILRADSMNQFFGFNVDRYGWK